MDLIRVEAFRILRAGLPDLLRLLTQPTFGDDGAISVSIRRDSLIERKIQPIHRCGKEVDNIYAGLRRLRDERV